MVDDSHRVLRLLPPLKLVVIIIAEILLKVALNTKNQSINQMRTNNLLIKTQSMPLDTKLKLKLLAGR